MRGKNFANAKAVPTEKDCKCKRMIGPSPTGPKLCLTCRKPFKQGEAWRKYTSAADPEFGSYSIGIHERCDDGVD